MNVCEIAPVRKGGLSSEFDMYIFPAGNFVIFDFYSNLCIFSFDLVRVLFMRTHAFEMEFRCAV